MKIKGSSESYKYEATSEKARKVGLFQGRRLIVAGHWTAAEVFYR